MSEHKKNRLKEIIDTIDGGQEPRKGLVSKKRQRLTLLFACGMVIAVILNVLYLFEILPQEAFYIGFILAMFSTVLVNINSNAEKKRKGATALDGIPKNTAVILTSASFVWALTLIACFVKGLS